MVYQLAYFRTSAGIAPNYYIGENYPLIPHLFFTCFSLKYACLFLFIPTFTLSNKKNKKRIF